MLNCDTLIKKAKLELQNGNKEVAAEIFKQALELDSSCEEAVINLAGYYGAKKEFDACENLLKNAIKISPNIARYSYMLGSLLLKKGFHYSSAQYLKKALSLTPNNNQVRVALAETFAKHGDFDAALEALRPLLENNMPLFSAVILFSNISIVLNMNEDCQTLLNMLSKTKLNLNQVKQLDAAKQMLRQSKL